MKRLLTVLAVCFALAAGVAAQNPPPTPPQAPPQAAAADQKADQKAPEVIVTGCLVQGSGPTVFIVENAKKDPQSTSEKGVSFLVVASSPDLNLRSHLNHEIRITGQSDGKTPPASGGKIEEKDLPKLTAKSVAMVSNTCAF
jgi:hypothetical protein